MQILFTVHSKLNGSKNSFNPHITCFCFFILMLQVRAAVGRKDSLKRQIRRAKR